MTATPALTFTDILEAAGPCLAAARDVVEQVMASIGSVPKGRLGGAPAKLQLP